MYYQSILYDLEIDISQWFKSKNKKYQPWTDDEVKKLQQAVKQYTDSKGIIHWKKVSQYVKTRTDRQCSEKWNTRVKNRQHKLVPGQVKWTEQEEQTLIQLVQQHGYQWNLFSDFFSPDKNDPVQLKQKFYNMQRRKAKNQNNQRDYSLNIESTGSIQDFNYPFSDPELNIQNVNELSNIYLLSDDDMFTN